MQSDFISHLGDIAIRTGRTIRWDLQQETIIGDEIAQRMMQRAMRAPWSLSVPHLCLHLPKLISAKAVPYCW